MMTQQYLGGEEIMSTHTYSRRGFIGLTGAGIACVAGAGWARVAAAAAAADARHADLVVFNARVYTVDPSMPRAEAFAVRAGKFIAVGSSADVKGLVGRSTEAVDAGR